MSISIQEMKLFIQNMKQLKHLIDDWFHKLLIQINKILKKNNNIKSIKNFRKQSSVPLITAGLDHHTHHGHQSPITRHPKKKKNKRYSKHTHSHQYNKNQRSPTPETPDSPSSVSSTASAPSYSRYSPKPSRKGNIRPSHVKRISQGLANGFDYNLLKKKKKKKKKRGRARASTDTEKTAPKQIIKFRHQTSNTTNLTIVFDEYEAKQQQENNKINNREIKIEIYGQNGMRCAHENYKIYKFWKYSRFKQTN